jgi:hypothetical protein
MFSPVALKKGVSCSPRNAASIATVSVDQEVE